MSATDRKYLTLTIIAVLMMIGIFLLDLATPLGVTIGVLYVAPILITLWLPQREATLVAATAGTSLIVLKYLVAPADGIFWMVVSNRLLSIGIVWATALLCLQHKQAYRKLRQEQEEQQIIFNSVPAMIWYKDKQNRILRANLPAARSLGLRVDQVEGRSTYELYPEEALNYHKDDLEVYTTGLPKLGIIERYQIASGEKRWVQTDKIPYRDENGRIIGVIVFAVDITERKRMEEALRRSNEELEQRLSEEKRNIKTLD